jgi:hypothetical protein
MTNEEMITELKKFGDEHYPKSTVVREQDSNSDGMGMKEFMESLSYGGQKQDRTVPS